MTKEEVSMLKRQWFVTAGKIIAARQAFVMEGSLSPDAERLVEKMRSAEIILWQAADMIRASDPSFRAGLYLKNQSEPSSD